MFRELRRWAVVCGLLVAWLPLALAGADAQWKTVDGLVDAFVELGMRSSRSTREHTARKWTGPIRYEIVHRVGDEDLHSWLVETHLAELSAITGLEILPAASGKEANLTVVMTSEDLLGGDVVRHLGSLVVGSHRQLYRDSMCIASLHADARGAIVRGVALIPVDRARGCGDLVGCVVEELTHLMGLVNDTPLPMPTIFHHGDRRSTLSGLDHLLLQMLYDQRVKPGMAEEALRPLLREIASELQSHGQVDASEALAAGGRLASFPQ